jgi:hypothetical protein
LRYFEIQRFNNSIIQRFNVPIVPNVPTVPVVPDDSTISGEALEFLNL